MIFKKKYSTLLSPKLATHLISIRQKIHQYPELSLEEIKTTALIKAECSKLNCAYIKDLSPTG